MCVCVSFLGWCNISNKRFFYIITKNASSISRNFDKDNWWKKTQAISKCNQFSCLWWNIPLKNILFLLQGDAFLNTMYGEK